MAPSVSAPATTSVQVALRIRPQTQQDAISIPTRFQRSVIHATSSSTVTVEGSAAAAGPNPSPVAPASGPSAKKQVFAFDQVHAPATTQHELFTATAKPLISRFIEGFNCTILAYGQTSSGKTFTMTGIDLDADPSDPNNGMGIIPRAVSTIFSEAKQLKEERGNAWTFSIKGSFIEIYNEDLIDLLGMEDGSGGRREVQIREDKNGHIIWGGLREVQVRNTSDVMSLIRQGTSIRRTNETDMNAQSSRSHAIFSLTLTQKKYTGSGAPPRSASPQPPNGRSPSRLARPGSTYIASGNTSRMASPTFGRPSTPSFAAAMGRGGGLRPASSLGLHSDGRASLDDEPGEWVSIVSKFHFVDLAGSERLKRTAAAGERIKEGISINSGLLALGNVISALGDPSRAKSNMATHIPYRDSKLTRLLQDSLGGNTHTLMIACVSPAEYNVGETINTLKYANRARNIKNRAVLNEKEDGWDDVEWLQGTVLRLRKELKGIKEGGTATGNPVVHEKLSEVVTEGASKKVLGQLTELQNNYEGLREKFVERTEELTRLRQQLGEKHRTGSSGAVGGTVKYEEIVGPVIEEYEKTIEAMEAELSLNRAALRHTNEMVEEKDDELSALTERHSATELYLEELKSRVAKLQEREASTEAYVRDLEEKVKAYDETSVSSSESMTDLKREVMRFKEAESHSTAYIAELEARLAKSDESVLALQQTTERLEKECERRRTEVELLQTRLETLKQDGESWRADLDEREKKVLSLEKKLEEWERKKLDAGESRERLSNVASEVAHARRSLQVDLPVNGVQDAAGPDDASPTVNGHDDSRAITPDASLNQQLIALQQTHTATLADLSSVTAKYRDALREISDLAAQIQEAKLSNQQSSDEPTEEKPLDLSPRRRRGHGGRTREISEPQANGQGRRLFFRQAASTESLHSRSLSQSQSLSQELSSARSRKTSFSSHGTSSSISHSPLNSHSPSLPSLRPNLSISLPAGSLHIGTGERSITSLEKEIMRLQEVLKERESEISVLEGSLNNLTNGKPNGIANAQNHSGTEEKTMNGSAHGSPRHENPSSPDSAPQLDDIRKRFENGSAIQENGTERSGSVSETDESLDRLNELMLSMAQKESQHREIVEDLNAQLAQVRRQHDDLIMLSRDQASNMSAEIEALHKKYDADLLDLEELKQREPQLNVALEEAKAAHAAALEAAGLDRDEVLAAKATELETALATAREEHVKALDALREELDKAASSLQTSHSEHIAALETLKKEHDDALRHRTQEITRIQEEHAVALSKAQADHEEQIKRKESEFSITLQTTEEEYYNALTKLRSDHASKLEQQSLEHAGALERLREEHAGELKLREMAQDGLISESQSARTLAITELQEEHLAAAARKESAFAEELQQLKAEHSRALLTKDEDAQLLQDKLRAENDRIISQLKEEFRMEMEGMRSNLAAKEAELLALTTKLSEERDAALAELRSQHAEILRSIEGDHEEHVSQLNSAQSDAIKAALSKQETEYQTLARAHEDELTALKSAHQQVITETDARLANVQEQHRLALEQSELKTQELLEEQKCLRSSLDQLERRHSEERDTLRKEHDEVVQELEAHKAAEDEFMSVRDETRRHHEDALLQRDNQIKDLHSQLHASHSDREDLEAEVAQLRAELDKTRSEQSKLIQEASNRDSLVNELEKHRSVIAEMQENLQKVKDQKDNLQSEKSKQENLLKDLQAQIARSSPPPGRNVSIMPERGFRPGVTASKLPPPTPPPSIPPPPAPRPPHENHAGGSSQSSRESQSDTLLNGQHAADPKLTVRLEEQAKHIEEQEAMIKTLNKQLTHCETDLQTHMDIVSTLETSLGDSEKNLRKARMQATELARERDTLNNKLEALRVELAEAKREVVSVRRSIVEEKQSLEQRLDEERKAKERARAQLDTRMDELTKRKSKFACL